MHKSDARAVDGKSQMACRWGRYWRWKRKVRTILEYYHYFANSDYVLSLILYKDVFLKPSHYFSDKEELVKISKEDKLAHTPADMTGNELDFNQKRRKTNQSSGNNIFGYDGDDGNDELGFEENEYPWFGHVLNWGLTFLQ